MDTPIFPVEICDGCEKEHHGGNSADCIGCERTPKPPTAPENPGIFNPAKTLAVVLAPGGMVHHALSGWLHWLNIRKIEWREAFSRNYEDAYNGLIIDHALHKRNRWAEQFIVADCDLRPNDKQTSHFLELPGDIRCVEYSTEVGPAMSWGLETSFHTGIWWTTRPVLEAIRPPWFRFQKSANGCRTEGCICQSFRMKALDAGYTIRHGGHAGHTPRPSRCCPHGESARDLI